MNIKRWQLATLPLFFIGTVLLLWQDDNNFDGNRSIWEMLELPNLLAGLGAMVIFAVGFWTMNTLSKKIY
jgi:drug/metabolite transporter (DMT)-like permease